MVTTFGGKIVYFSVSHTPPPIINPHLLSAEPAETFPPQFPPTMKFQYHGILYITFMYYMYICTSSLKKNKKEESLLPQPIFFSLGDILSVLRRHVLVGMETLICLHYLLYWR